MDWEEFLDPYIQAVGELKIKLRGIRKQFRKQNRHSVSYTHLTLPTILLV